MALIMTARSAGVSCSGWPVYGSSNAPQAFEPARPGLPQVTAPSPIEPSLDASERAAMTPCPIGRDHRKLFAVGSRLWRRRPIARRLWSRRQPPIGVVILDPRIAAEGAGAILVGVILGAAGRGQDAQVVDRVLRHRPARAALVRRAEHRRVEAEIADDRIVVEGDAVGAERQSRAVVDRVALGVVLGDIVAELIVAPGRVGAGRAVVHEEQECRCRRAIFVRRVACDHRIVVVVRILHQRVGGAPIEIGAAVVDALIITPRAGGVVGRRVDLRDAGIPALLLVLFVELPDHLVAVERIQAGGATAAVVVVVRKCAGR